MPVRICRTPGLPWKQPAKGCRSSFTLPQSDFRFPLYGAQATLRISPLTEVSF